MPRFQSKEELLLLCGKLRLTHSHLGRRKVWISPLDSGTAGPPLRHEVPPSAAEVRDLPYYPYRCLVWVFIETMHQRQETLLSLQTGGRTRCPDVRRKPGL